MSPGIHRRTDHPAPPPAERAIGRALFGLLFLLVLCLQIQLYRHAGSFWRDEASSIQVAGSPSLAAMWRCLWAVSYPGLFLGVLHLWIAAGPGATQAGIRLLGTVIALGGVLSMLASARALTRRVPLLALSLTALNGAIFYFGSSIRAYGLSVLLIPPCFAAFWKVARSPTKANVPAAFALALLTVHCNYQNACLLFGIGLAGAAACARRGLWKRTSLIAAIVAAAALSLLVYLPIIRTFRAVSLIPAAPPAWTVLASNFCAALAGGSPALLALWAIVLAAALALLVRRSYAEERNRSAGGEPSLSSFSLIAFAASAIAGLIFFRESRMFPYAWHWAPFVALAALTAELGLDALEPAARRAACGAALAVLIAAVSAGPALRASGLRRTNLDLVAAALERDAVPGDLILLTSVWLSPGFNYQYRGKAEWNILPMIPTDRDSRLEVGGQIKKLLTDPRAIQPTLDRVEKTLRAGRRVWYLDGPDRNPLWLMQFGQFLQDHAARGERIPIPVDGPVSDLENVSLYFVEGWRS